LVTNFGQFCCDICTVMKALFTTYKINLIGAVAGGLTGYLYYSFVGCRNGSCLIASNPLVSVPYFAAMGLLVSSIFKKH